jgi:predicted RNase H-like HicB family nuclease
MTRYVGVIEKDPGSLWGIWFPDLPGCVSAGESADEVIENAVDVLRVWAELAEEDGVAMPIPRNAAEIRTDPDVVESASRGGMFIVIPLVRDSGRTVRANISIDAGTLAAIDEAAKARGLTRSAFLVSAARDKILSEV